MSVANNPAAIPYVVAKNAGGYQQIDLNQIRKIDGGIIDVQRGITNPAKVLFIDGTDIEINGLEHGRLIQALQVHGMI